MAASAPVRKYIRSYEDLDVYQRALDLVRPVYDLVAAFPDIEKYGLCDQTRRACRSVPANIAEAYGRRRSPKQFQSMLDIALGSANEMEAHFKIAYRLAYISDDVCNRSVEEYRVVARQLYRLIQHWRNLDTLPPGSSLQEPSP